MEEESSPAETGEQPQQSTEEEAVSEQRPREETAEGRDESGALAAPDVTYEATLLEQSETTTTAGGAGEGETASGNGGGAGKDKAVRFREHAVQERSPPAGRGGRREEEEDWLDILGSGDLKKKVVRAGDGLDTRPTPLSRVRIRTKGQLDSGTVVDRHSSIPFTLGDGDVLQAWDLSVSLMEIGELALIRTSPRFAYGQQGRSPDIPANSSITYELELLEVQPPVDYATVTEKELTTLIDRKRIRGNELFQRKDFQLAVNSYDKALKLIQNYSAKHESEELPSGLSDMHIRCLNNLAAAYLKVERYKESQEACQKVLEKDPENVKALFRYGKVLAVQGEASEAVKHLQKAMELNPGERAIQVELQKAQKKKERVEKEERAMYTRMVSGSSLNQTELQANTQPSLWSRLMQGPLPYLAGATAIAIVGIAIAYYFTQT